MLEILQSTDKQVIKAAFCRTELPYCECGGMIEAKDRDESIGYSLYYLEDDKMTILKVEPKEDIMLFDGILRSTLHIAAQRSIMNAFYCENFCGIDNLKTLGFIKNEAERTLDIDLLFGGCKGCE